jgi:hypothetical protein
VSYSCNFRAALFGRAIGAHFRHESCSLAGTEARPAKQVRPPDAERP